MRPESNWKEKLETPAQPEALQKPPLPDQAMVTDAAGVMQNRLEEFYPPPDNREGEFMMSL